MTRTVLENGRSLCTRENPKPVGVSGRWEHEGATDIGECFDGCCDRFKCADCGEIWTQEVAQ